MIGDWVVRAYCKSVVAGQEGLLATAVVGDTPLVRNGLKHDGTRGRSKRARR
jgi:hypothetical protein